MASQVIFHGSPDEARELVDAVAKNCACTFGTLGVRLTTCAPHLMVVSDQRALDGLLFARYQADRLKAEEDHG